MTRSCQRSGRTSVFSMRQLAVGADEKKGRVAVLDDAGFAGAGHVDDGEGGVADFADTADGQRVHDDLRRAADVHGAGGELKSHGGRHGGEHAGFDAAAEAVGEDGDDAAFLLTFWERKTSPEINWPCLARWQESTSMKLSAVLTAAPRRGVVAVLRGERAHDGVEDDLRVGGVFTEEIGDLLHGLEVLLDDLARAIDDLLFLEDGFADVAEDSTQTECGSMAKMLVVRMPRW